LKREEKVASCEQTGFSFSLSLSHISLVQVTMTTIGRLLKGNLIKQKSENTPTNSLNFSLFFLSLSFFSLDVVCSAAH
jgi:hypothetical protein